MYFSIVVAFATLLFLVGAVPVSQKLSRAGRPFSIPLSKRTNHLDHRGFVDIENIKAGIHYTKARFDRTLMAYERNMGEPHPLSLKRGHSNERRLLVSEHLKPGQTAFVPYVVWSADISIGTPGRAFPVSIDTISSDMYLDTPSSECSSLCFSEPGTNVYNMSLSSTGKDLGFKGMGTFGFGNVTGDVVSDSVSVEGFGVPHQKIILAKSLDYFVPLPNIKWVGVLGMGRRKASALDDGSWFSSLIDLNGPEYGDRTFALTLDDSDAELIGGGTDASKFVGELTYLNVNTTSDYWQIPMESISVNRNVIGTNMQAILDSDNLFIGGDTPIITNIYNNIPGSELIETLIGIWSVPCDTKATITMTFGGTAFELPPSAYIISNVAFTPSDTTTICLGAFSDIQVGLPNTLIIGNAFMKNLYTEFDQGNMRVGFALRRPPPRVSSPPL